MKVFRTGIAAVLAGILGMGCLAGEAAALPPLYGVTVAWADPGHTHVKVTWHETVVLANKVQVWSGQQAGWSTVVTAGSPNQVLVPALDVPKNTVARIAVSLGTTASSPHVDSVDFDTNTPATPVITAAFGDYDHTTELVWKAGTPPADTTPGDPLDLPQGPVRFQVGWRYPAEAGWSPVTPLGPELTAIAKPTVPEDRVYHLAVLTSPNEWGPADVETVGNLTLFRASEGSAQWATADTIVAHVNGWDCGFPCDQTMHLLPQKGRTVVLQHRASSAAPWSTTEVSTSATDGLVMFNQLSHSGQYRIVVPPRSYVQTIRFVNNGFIAPVLA